MTATARAGGLRQAAQAHAPGVLIAVTIAAASTFISEHYGAPAMLFALLIGMAFQFLSVEGPCVVGIQFTSSTLLKTGVALVGFRVSLSDLASLGPAPALIIPALIILTIAAGASISLLLGRGVRFGVLTGGAVAICGASAALAISAALPRRQGAAADSDPDALFTVIAVTSLSTLAMIVYPALFAGLGFSDRETGYLIGATIHDVAQVIGAGYAVSDEAGAVATYVKLLRVACLPVAVIAISLGARRSLGAAPAPFPWFAVAFAACLAANSLAPVAPPLRAGLAAASQWLLVAALAALGMKTSLKAMMELGPRHFGVVAAETVFLLLAALAAGALIR